jgi:hypothetical protein
VTKEIQKVGEGCRLKMGYVAYIKYKAYFFKDHVIFDQNDNLRIELGYDDSSWPNGLITGVEKMRKKEIAKIYIKKKHGFGRELKQEELRWPEGDWKERLQKE